MNQKSGFNVPAGYFDTLRMRAMEMVAAEKNRHGGFDTPEDYFAANSDKLIKLSGEATIISGLRVIRFNKIIRRSAAVAAAVLLTAGVWISKTNSRYITVPQLAIERIDSGFEKPVTRGAVNEHRGQADEGDAEAYLLNNYSQSDLLAEL